MMRVVYQVVGFGRGDSRLSGRHGRSVWSNKLINSIFSAVANVIGQRRHILLLWCSLKVYTVWHTHTHTRLTALFPGLPRWAGTRKVKPIWILLEQETVSGSGISWAVCKSASHSRQITTPALHHSVFTGRMPFLSPNQQRQSTEGWSLSL